MPPNQPHELGPILEKAELMLRPVDATVADEVAAAVKELGNGRLCQETVPRLWVLFAPTCDWDDLVIDDLVGDVELGNEAFAILCELRETPDPAR